MKRKITVEMTVRNKMKERTMYFFQANIPGKEETSLDFALWENGEFARTSKHFENLPEETQAEAIKLAKELLPSVE